MLFLGGVVNGGKWKKFEVVNGGLSVVVDDDLKKKEEKSVHFLF